jgi:hypothetical protein
LETRSSLHQADASQVIDEVTLKGLRVGEGAVDVLIRRHGERTALEVLGTRGHVDIITEEGD